MGDKTLLLVDAIPVDFFFGQMHQNTKQQI